MGSQRVGHDWATFTSLHFISLKCIWFNLQISWSDYMIHEHSPSHIDIKSKKEKPISLWWELLGFILNFHIVLLTAVFIVLLFITVVYYSSGTYLSYKWKFVPFNYLHPLSPLPFPSHWPPITTNLISFLWDCVFICFWSIIDLQHYVSSLYTT